MIKKIFLVIAPDKFNKNFREQLTEVKQIAHSIGENFFTENQSPGSVRFASLPDAVCTTTLRRVVRKLDIVPDDDFHCIELPLSDFSERNIINYSIEATEQIRKFSDTELLIIACKAIMINTLAHYISDSYGIKSEPQMLYEAGQGILIDTERKTFTAIVTVTA